MSLVKKSKVVITELMGHVLWLTGQTKPANYANDKLTVITFHRVLTSEQRLNYPLPALAVTPEELDWLCAELKEHFNCGSFTTIYNSWCNNEKTDKPFLALTFDDGQLDNLVNAKPVLAKHQLDATFYIPIDAINTQENIWHDRLGFALQICMKSETKYSELQSLLKQYFQKTLQSDNLLRDITEETKQLTPDERAQFTIEIENIANTEIPDWAAMMTWDQVKELAAAGHEIGSHTMSHALLPQLTDDALTYEIAESRKALEQQLDIDIESFCYPNGDENDRVQKVVETYQYKNAVTTITGLNRRDVKPFAIKRFGLDSFQYLDSNDKLSKTRLHFRMSGLHPGLRW